MSDTELYALSVAVQAEQFGMEAENYERQQDGKSLAYTEAGDWPAYNTLREELRRRAIIQL